VSKLLISRRYSGQDETPPLKEQKADFARSGRSKFERKSQIRGSRAREHTRDWMN
jgi:hypothetical protein